MKTYKIKIFTEKGEEIEFFECSFDLLPMVTDFLNLVYRITTGAT